MKITDHPWGTKQSCFVPSCLWSYLTTIEALNSLILSHPSCLWSYLTTIDVLNSLDLSHRVCEVIWQQLRYQTVSFCPIVFVELSDNPWGTKHSLFVPSCLWRYLTTLEVPNSLTLSHRVCGVVWQHFRYYTVSLCPIVFAKLSYNPWCTKQSHFVPKLSDNPWGTKQSQFVR